MECRPPIEVYTMSNSGWRNSPGKTTPLGRLSSHIDFEFFRKSLSALRDVVSDSSKGVRTSHDQVLMF
jgi:hypothetical protein